MRKCIGCGASFDKSTLIRIVQTEDKSFVTDPDNKMPGRGSYVCRSRVCVCKLIKCKGLDRSYKIKVPSSDYDKLEQDLEKELAFDCN